MDLSGTKAAKALDSWKIINFSILLSSFMDGKEGGGVIIELAVLKFERTEGTGTAADLKVLIYFTRTNE